MSDDFNLDQVLDNQNLKESTINSAIGQLAQAMANFLAVDLTASNHTLDATEQGRYVYYRRTDTTAARALTVLAKRRFFFVENSAVSTDIKLGSTTLAMIASELAMFYTDGTANGLVKVLSSAPSAVTTISTFFQLTGDISPAQIVANTNDYNPTGLAAATILRLNTDASRDLTGLAGGADGRVVFILNVGSFDLVLKNASGSSSASNRFLLGGTDVTLTADKGAFLLYDSTSSRWRLIGGTGSGGGGVTVFTDLSDVPANYTSAGLKIVRVNSGASGLEFVDQAMIMPVFVPGVMTNAQLVYSFIATEDMRLVSGATGSQAKSGVASAGNVHFDIKKNGSDLGDVTFNTSSTGSFTVGSDIDLAAGDLFQVYGPAIADGTLADVAMSFKWKRMS